MTEIIEQTVKPHLVAFEVTRRCRFKCRHCRAAAGYGTGAADLTTDQCKRVIKSVADFGSCVLIFTGGEPMERKDIYDLIRHSTERGLRPVMASCGYLIDAQAVDRLKDAGILALSLSLDGAAKETHDHIRGSEGAFDATVRAAAVAKKARMKFQINTTISKVNLDEVAGIVELAKRLGASCFNAFMLVPTGRAEQMTDLLLDPVEYETLLHELLDLKLSAAIDVRVTCGPQFARVCDQNKAKGIIDVVNGCMGGREFGFISYKGDVQTCGFLNISAGNLVNNGFDFGRIWTASEYLKKIRDRSNLKGKCAVCDYIGICGGCRARAFAVCNDFLAADPICAHIKAKVKK